jgi:hypothetical protein
MSCQRASGGQHIGHPNEIQNHGKLGPRPLRLTHPGVPSTPLDEQFPLPTRA